VLNQKIVKNKCTQCQIKNSIQVQFVTNNLKTLQVLLGKDKKCDERQEHTNHGKGGKEAGINIDLSEGPNKSKYKNEKKTTARVRQHKGKGEKLSSDSPSS